MTAHPNSAAPNQTDLDAALLLLSRMGTSPDDLRQAAPSRPPAPTFAEYIPVVSFSCSRIRHWSGSRSAGRSSSILRLHTEIACRTLVDPRLPMEYTGCSEDRKETPVMRGNSVGTDVNARELAIVGEVW